MYKKFDLLAIVVLLSLGGCSLAQPLATADQTATKSDGETIIAAYFYLFDDGYDEAMSVQDSIPWKKINRLYIAFATVDDGTLTDKTTSESPVEQTEQKIRNIIALCRRDNPDAEIFISSDFGDQSVDEQYLAAAEDPQRFADSVALYLNKYDLDGYDMDWETRQINDYALELQTLLCTCYSTLKQAGMNPHGRPYKLSHTIWPGVHSPETVASLKDCVDNINLMTYGPGQDYDLISYAESYHEAGFPYEKMIGGVESEFGYTENGGHDTQDSIQEKCDYAKQVNLGGMFSWRLDNDMRTADGVTESGPPTFQVSSWLYQEMAE
ncbi:Glycosyl hydrolases family 18 [uncultured archaeon]|nr:Glycosyl hydrolases family 18 [uncultured archaeon]